MSTLHRRKTDRLFSESLNQLGSGLSDMAAELNPIHPKTSMQASLLLAAVVAGLCAYFYAELIALLQAFYYRVFHAHPYLLLLACPPLFVAATWLVVRFAPEAKGSGIPQVLQAIEEAPPGKPEARETPLVSIRTAAVKVLSSAVGILGGASIGREGPTVQISSSLFAFTARHARRYFGSLDFQSYLTAGASAGISAAFNTPLAGVTFALEEIGEHSFAQFKRTVMLAVIVGGITAQAIGGNYLYFGHPTIPSLSNSIFSVSVLLGVLGGLFGGLFSIILTRPRLNILPSKWWMRALACGLLVSLLNFLTHSDTSGSGYEVTKQFMDTPGTSLPMLLFPAKFITTVFSYLSGMAGGIFSPCLSVGSGLGFTTAQIFHVSNLRACALIGMVAFFSGVVQAPLTSVIIVMEMTDQSMLLIPFMVAAFLAHGIGHLLMPVPLYHRLAEMAMGKTTDKEMAEHGEALKGPSPEPLSILDQILVVDAMDTETQTVTPDLKITDFAKRLYQTQNRSFPVLDGESGLVGIVSQKDVTNALGAEKAGEKTIGDIMTRDLITCAPGQSLRSILEKYKEYSFQKIPVVDPRDKRILLGSLSRENILWAYIELSKEYQPRKT